MRKGVCRNEGVLGGGRVLQLRKMSGFCSSDGSGGGIGSLLFIQIMEMNEIFSLIQITEMNEIPSLTYD